MTTIESKKITDDKLNTSLDAIDKYSNGSFFNSSKRSNNEEED